MVKKLLVGSNEEGDSKVYLGVREIVFAERFTAERREIVLARPREEDKIEMFIKRS